MSESMEFFIRDRVSGKTMDAVKWVLESPDLRVLVVHSVPEAKRIHVEYKIPLRSVLSYSQVRAGGLRGRDVTVCIDNAEWFIQDCFGPIEVRRVYATGRLGGSGA